LKYLPHAWKAEKILRDSDFASIGTNDLVQYLFAVDRNNDEVAGDYSYDSDVLWELLGNIASAAANRGKKGVCLRRDGL